MSNKKRSVNDHHNTRPFHGAFKENVKYSTKEDEIYHPYIERYEAPYTSIQYFGKNGKVTSTEKIDRNQVRTVVKYKNQDEDKTPEEVHDYDMGYSGVEEYVVQEEQVFEYCSHCSTFTVALVKAGLFLLSPVNPLGTVRFSLCEILTRFHNVYAASGEKIAEFMSFQHSNSTKHLSAENCSNAIILFNKMVQLAESKVIEGKNTCAACPKVQYDDLWLLEEKIASNENEAVQTNLEQATPQPRRFNAIIKQGVTSTVYPLRSVFGSGCARHDTVFKLADMCSGEGFKYPLACIESLEDKEDRKVPLHFMYDVVCRLEPAIKMNPIN